MSPSFDLAPSRDLYRIAKRYETSLAVCDLIADAATPNYYH